MAPTPPIAPTPAAPSDSPRADRMPAGAGFTRVMTLEIRADASKAADDERIPVALSSELPVRRYDWWDGAWYEEVLDHGRDAVDLSYAGDGMPFLDSHNTREQHGILEEVTVDGDRKLRAMLRMSKSARAQEIRQDILDHIRKKVSIAYSIERQVLESTTGTMKRYRVTRWTPYEGSTVAIPADYSVGINRSADGAAVPFRILPGSEPPRVGKEKVMANETDTAQVADQARTAERTRVNEIRKLGTRFTVAEEKVEAWVTGGASPDQVAREILLERQAELDNKIQNPTTAALDLPERENKPFSIGRALVAMATGNWANAGYERAISMAVAKKLQRESSGILIPNNVRLAGLRMPGLQQRTVLSVAGSTTGADMVFTEAGPFIDVLRNLSVVLRMGTPLLSGLQGNLALPKQLTPGTAAKVAENPGSDFSESNMTLDQVNWTPKNLASTQAYSKQLLAQSVEAIDQLVINDILAVISLLFDYKCLHGPGSGDITGLYGITGVNSVAMGGAITFPGVVAMESAVEADNAAVGTMGYVTTPEIKGRAKSTQMFAGSNGVPLWTGGVDGEMNGYRALASNQVSKTLESSTKHGLLFGAWSSALAADWGAIDLTVDMFTRARQGLVNVTGLYLADFNTRYPEAFAKATGLTNTLDS